MTSLLPDHPNTGDTGQPNHNSKSLASNSEKLAQIPLELLPVAAFCSDEEGMVRSWNRIAVELWRGEPAPGTPLRVSELLRPALADGARGDPSSEGSETSESRLGPSQRDVPSLLDCLDGSRRRVLASQNVLYGDSGSRIGTLTLLHEGPSRTEGKHWIGSAAGGEDEGWRVRSVMEQLPTAAYTCDRDGRITDYNRRAVELWGREPKRYDLADRY